MQLPLVGTAGSLSLLLDGMLPIQLILYVLANLMLITLGCTWRVYRGWRLASSIRLYGVKYTLTRRLLPANTLPRALGLGLLWGWLPCGLVYGILMTLLLVGNPLNGAAIAWPRSDSAPSQTCFLQGWRYAASTQFAMPAPCASSRVRWF